MPEPDYLLGIHDFAGRTQDELDIAKGDYIEVIEDDAEFGDSWYIGRNLTTNNVGLFPKVFTTSVVSVPPDVSLHAESSQYSHNQKKPSQSVVTGHSSHARDKDVESLATAQMNTQGALRINSEAKIDEKPYSPKKPASTPAYAQSPQPSQRGRYQDLPRSEQPNEHPQERSESSLDTNGEHIDSKAKSDVAGVSAAMLDIDQALSELAESSMPSLEAVGFWSPPDVRTYFLARGYDADTAEKFVQHQINGSILLELDLNFLKEIDITSFGIRYELSKEIQYLCQVVEVSKQPLPGSRTPTIGDLPTFSSTPTNGVAAASPHGGPTLLGRSPPTQALVSKSRDESPHVGEQDATQLQSSTPRRDTPNDRTQPQAPNRTNRQSQIILNPISSVASTTSKLHSDSPTLSESTSVAESTSMASSAGNLEEPTLKHTRSTSDLTYGSVPLVTPPSQTSTTFDKKPSHRRHSSIASVLSDGTPYKPSPTRVKEVPKRAGTFKSLRSASSQYLRPKKKTSAFTEGIKDVTAQNSAKSAVFSGWMHKRGGISVGTWKARYFTLHGTRLSYFASFKDTKERGLIDITGHKASALQDNEDKLVSLYATGVGAGRYCFKLVPPGPGYKKGVSFTAPKTHYFAVETEDQMREWISALTKATIERDVSVPVISSCTTPTISLPKAKELMAERLAAENNESSIEPHTPPKEQEQVTV